MNPPPRSLRGLVAVVTGASSGIGRALALALASEGVALVLGGRSRALLEEVAALVEARGSRARALVVDVRREADLQELLRAAQELGGLDLMVNNAGVGYQGPVLEGRTADWREVLETNLLAVCVGSREAARAMLGRGGTIVNVCSTAGLEAVPGDAVYSASKHGVDAFSRALRAELAGTGIEVLVVHPGQVMTSFGRGLAPERVRTLARSLGLDPAAVPDFQGAHVPPAFAQAVLRAAPEAFLAPEQVAAAVVEALGRERLPETVVVRPPRGRA